MNELHVHSQLERARTYFDEGRKLHAIQVLQQVIAAEPSCLKAYTMLAHMYEESGSSRAAERLLINGVEANESNQEYYFMLGDFYYQSQQFEKAVKYLEVIRHFKDPHLHMQLGAAYVALKRLKDAEKELRLAAALEPNLPKVYETWGEILLMQSRFEEAKDVLLHATRADQYTAAGHRLLGEAYLHLSDLDKAYDTLVLAVDLDPEDAMAWFLCGNVLLRLKRYSEASIYLARALHLHPKFPEAEVDYQMACAMLEEQTSDARPSPLLMALHE